MLALIYVDICYGLNQMNLYPLPNAPFCGSDDDTNVYIV